MTQALPTRRWRFRFGLRTLLFAVVVFAVPLGFLARSLQSAARQRQAVEALEKSGFACDYNYGVDGNDKPIHKPRMPVWLISLFGQDLFYNVESIDSSGSDNPKAFAHLRDLRHLQRIAFDDLPGDAITPYLSDLDQLKVMDLSHCNLSDGGLEHLRGLITLKVLSLRDNPITGAGLIHLCDSPALKSLDVQGTSFDDTGMGCLARLTQLEELFVDSPDVTDQGLAFLASMTAMHRLYIGKSGISDKGMIYLRYMPGMEHLILGGSLHAGDAGLVYLERMDSLRTLNLDQCGVSDDGLIHIGHITSLQVLSLDGDQITSAGLAHLERLSDLYVLSLLETTIDDLSHLTRLATLRDLRLAGCNISGTGLNALSQLNSLDLSKVKVTDSVLSGLLPLELSDLSLDDTNIDIPGLEKLAAMRNLESLSLKGCAVGDSAIPALKTFPSLEQVYVNKDTFSMAGMKDLHPIAVYGN
jgi:Leucine-rich repeat (LRR) protein